MSRYLKVSEIRRQLHQHAPFTALGTLSGVAIIIALQASRISYEISSKLFWTLHPIHVLLSALATAAMYRLNASRRFLDTLLIGYLGSVGIATLSDSIIPYVGEWLLQLPNRGIHIGFIEKWWLVNPLSFLGIAIAWFWPRTKFPHAGHVFLSTWASLFHMMMALGDLMSPTAMAAAATFLFLAVWIPCCTSDIVFPLLFAKRMSSDGATLFTGSLKSDGEIAVVLGARGPRSSTISKIGNHHEARDIQR